ncbi:MAG: hypothetical protein AAGA64_12965 [Bacteroidota bacterium]
MTKNSYKAQNLISYAMALFLGGILGEASAFIAYYFGKYFSDSIILLLLAIGSFWVGSLLHKRSNSLLLILNLLMFFQTIGSRFIYKLYQLTEWTATALYVVIIGLSFLSGWQQTLEKSKRLTYVSIMVASLAACALGLETWEIFTIGVILIVYSQLTMNKTRQTTLYLLIAMPAITLTLFFTPPPTLFERQSRYFDPLVFSRETPFQIIDITSWKGQQWFYYDNINQFSSIDHWLYFEPMAHVASQVTKKKERVLVIGGENGMLVDQLLKYKSIKSIDIAPIDKDLYQMACKIKHFVQLNNKALESEKINQLDANVFNHLGSHNGSYDLMFIDVPDPVDIELNQYYTIEFYNLCRQALTNQGILVTQAGSPYYATKAFNCIDQTVRAADLVTLPLHNQVLTLGEWGWIIAFKNIDKETVYSLIENTEFDQIETKWLDKEAVRMMMAFGKQPEASDSIINSLKKPIVHLYYTTGTWKLQ